MSGDQSRTAIVPPDLVTRLVQHLPDEERGPGWTCQVPDALLVAAITEIQALRGVVRKVILPEPTMTTALEVEAVIRAATGEGSGSPTEADHG